jgi:hypothetical protein
MTNSNKLELIAMMRNNVQVYILWDREKNDEIATFYSHATAEAVRCYLIASAGIDAPWA